MANCKEKRKESSQDSQDSEKVEIKTILASSFLSDHSNSNIIIHVRTKVSSLIIFIIN